MKISLKVAFNFTLLDNGPAGNCNIEADIDGDGPDVIELERMSNEHQRAMARDAHEFMQAAAPVLFELLASLRETGPDRPAGDTLENRIAWLEEEQRAMVSRIAAIESGRLSVHEDRIMRLEEASIPAGWRPSNLTHERTGATAFMAGQTWAIYEPGAMNPCAAGATLDEAIRNAWDRFSPDSEEG